MHCSLSSLLLAATFVVLTSTTVAAQPATPTSANDAEARALFLSGRTAFDRGDYRTALEHFQRAYELSQRAGLLFNIGHSAMLLQQHEVALEAFRKYLVEMPDADNRGQVEARIASLEREVEERELLVEAARRNEADATAAPATSPRDDGPGVLPWVALGVSGAITVAGVILLALAGSAASTVDDAPAGTPWNEVEGDYDAAGTLGVAGGITLATGLVAAGLSTLWLLLGGSSEDARAHLTPTGLGLSWSAM